MEEIGGQHALEQEEAIRELVKLENQFHGGVRWFFFIAGLSLLNSAIYFFGAGFNFIIGLGITQIIDGVIGAIIVEVDPSAATVVRTIGFLLVLGVTGLFAGLGLLSRRKHQWAYVTGMVLYALDGLLFLLVGDVLSIGFHIFALAGLFSGWYAFRKLRIYEREGVVRKSQTITPRQQRDRAYWLRLGLLAFVLLIPLFLFLTFFFLNY